MKHSIPPERVRQLFVWLQRYQPHIGEGLIRRFTPRERLQALSGLGGIFDFIGTAVQGVTNFAQTQGFDKLLTAAQPFIKTAVEKSALKLQLERIKAGLPPAPPDQAAAGPGGPGDPANQNRTAGPGDPGAAAAERPWYARPGVLIGGGIALMVGAAMFLGSPRGRRA